MSVYPSHRCVYSKQWDVEPAPDNADQYIITTPGFRPPHLHQGVGPVRAGWGRIRRKRIETEGLDHATISEADIKADKEAEEEGILPHPDLPVLFTTTIKNWNIDEANDGGGDPEKATYVYVPFLSFPSLTCANLFLISLGSRFRPNYSVPLPLLLSMDTM